MLQRSDMHDYQHRAVSFIVDRAPRPSALFLDMSLGKTIITLTAIVDLLETLHVYGVLVIAPRRVAESVWAQEAEAWQHTRHLRVAVLRGRSKPLLARSLLRRHDIWVANYEALPWLIGQVNALYLEKHRYPPFNMVIFDELSRAKNPTGSRISALRPLLEFMPYRVGLTGTPAANGYWDLHGEFQVLDDGYRLGHSQREWRERFFIENEYTRKRIPAPGAKEHIENLIRDMTLSLSAEDYLQLPDYIYNDIIVDLPSDILTAYREFEENLFAELDHGALEVFNTAALTNKCRQLANGCVIDTANPDLAHPVHDRKLEALDSVLEEAGGSGVLCAYVFRADMHRIIHRYAGRYRLAYLGPGVSDAQSMEIVLAWNRGEYDMLVSHWASAGHGLNLQQGGHQLVWFGLDWSLEGYLQMNARLRRQGQTAASVIVHRILARDTIDLAVRDALEHKATDQAGLRKALEDYRKSKEGN